MIFNDNEKSVNENDEDKVFIYNIANIIEDIRIERRMSKEFGVDKKKVNNYPDTDMYCVLKHDNPIFDTPKMDFLIYQFYCMVNEFYRDMQNIIITGKIFYLKFKLINIIDDFLISDDKASDTARKILEILRTEDKKRVKFLNKVKENQFVIDIDGINAFICLSSDLKHRFNEGDEIQMENLISIYDYIIHLIEIKPENAGGNKNILD